MRASLVRSVVVLAIVAFAPAAYGDDAEQLFVEGKRAEEAGDHALACAKFAESERLEPAPGTLANLADCEEKLGKLTAAAEHFRLAASGFAKHDKRRNTASERATAIEQRVPRLVLTAPADAPNGILVTKDGIVVAPEVFGTVMLADPGEVVVEVLAPGRHVRTYRVRLAERDAVTVSIAIGDPAPPEGPRTDVVVRRGEDPGHRAPPNRTLAYSLGGAGIASIATGAVLGVLALDRASTVREHCDANLVCDPQGLDAASSGELFAPLSTITIAAGLALLGVALTIMRPF